MWRRLCFQVVDHHVHVLRTQRRRVLHGNHLREHGWQGHKSSLQRWILCLACCDHVHKLQRRRGALLRSKDVRQQNAHRGDWRNKGPLRRTWRQLHGKASEHLMYGLRRRRRRVLHAKDMRVNMRPAFFPQLCSARSGLHTGAYAVRPHRTPPPLPRSR